MPFVLLVASELIVARSGLGYMIGWLGDGGVYDAMFAVVLTVAVLGFAADRGYLMLMKRVLRMARMSDLDSADRLAAARPSIRPRPSRGRVRPGLGAQCPRGLTRRSCVLLAWEVVCAQRRVTSLPAAAAVGGARADLAATRFRAISLLNLGLTLYRASGRLRHRRASPASRSAS